MVPGFFVHVGLTATLFATWLPRRFKVQGALGYDRRRNDCRLLSAIERRETTFECWHGYLNRIRAADRSSARWDHGA